MAHRLDVDAPITPIDVPPGITDVLVLLSQAGAVVGQSWIAVTGHTVSPEQVRQAINAHGVSLRHRRTRLQLEGAFGRPKLKPPATLVSVIVCTKDRPEQLRQCLESIRAVRHPRIEVLVVDNGSTTGATAGVCRELGVPMVVEPRPGQTSARNMGIAETSGELVAFTDDDVIVDPGWLDNIEAEFLDPLTMIATGYIGPGRLDTEPQVHFEAHGGFFRLPDRALMDPSATRPTFGASNCGAGANMVIRRRLFEAIGGFDETFGAGTPTRTADDKLFFYRTLEAGYRIQYDPAREVWHQHRSDTASLSRIMRDYGTGEFCWPAHNLRTRGDLDGYRVWRWWLGHFAKDILRWHLGKVAGIPPRYTLDEIRGALAGPAAMKTVKGSSPAGGPRAGTGWSGATTLLDDPADVADVRVEVISELPTVTVAIGSYNRRDGLQRVLRKLDAQSVPRERYEVVVVLDGSTDGSAEMVRELDVAYDLTLIEQPNLGLAIGRNRGAETAKHDLVVFLDDDIEPRPGFLAGHVLSHASRNEDTWVMGYFPPVVGNSYVDQGLRTWWERHFHRKRSAGHRWSMVDMVDGNSSVPARLFQRLGGFDTDFDGGRRQDYEMGARLIAAGIPMAFSDLAFADHHTKAGTGTAFNTAYVEGRNDAVLIKKHPGAWFESPIAQTPFGRRDVAAREFTERLGAPRGIEIADRLESLNRRRAWNRFMNAAWWGRYLSGFEAGAAGETLRAPAASTRRKVRIDVDAPVASAVPEHVGDVDFVLCRGGVALATIPALLPGEQWDWDDLIARATNAVVHAPAGDRSGAA